MADNELNLKINTEADKSKVEELSTAIEKVTENSEQASSIQQQCENQFTREVISTNYEYKWNEENYFKENSIY